MSLVLHILLTSTSPSTFKSFVKMGGLRILALWIDVCLTYDLHDMLQQIVSLCKILPVDIKSFKKCDIAKVLKHRAKKRIQSIIVEMEKKRSEDTTNKGPKPSGDNVDRVNAVNSAGNSMEERLLLSISEVIDIWTNSITEEKIASSNFDETSQKPELSDIGVSLIEEMRRRMVASENLKKEKESLELTEKEAALEVIRERGQGSIEGYNDTEDTVAYDHDEGHNQDEGRGYDASPRAGVLGTDSSGNRGRDPTTEFARRVPPTGSAKDKDSKKRYSVKYIGLLYGLCVWSCGLL